MYGSDAQPDRSARSEVGVTHTVAPGGEARGPARIAVVGAGPAGLYAVTELVESGHPGEDRRVRTAALAVRARPVRSRAG